MNSFCLISLLWFFPAFHAGNAGVHRNDIKWVIQKTSNLNIAGHTNVNSFACAVNQYTRPDTITCTLKQPQYPYLKIAFLSLEKIPDPQTRNESLKGCVDIEMAGVCKRFEINYELFVKDDACIELIGCRTFCFSDFGLEPPTKMGGIIRVKNEIDVQFHLYIQQIK
jgi:hypothetical protein